MTKTNRYWLPLLLTGALLAGFSSTKLAAQTSEFQVSCTQMGSPRPGFWNIYHQSRWWNFNLNVINRAASYTEQLDFEPDPAQSDNTNWLGLAKLLWSNVTVTANCWDRRTQLPGGQVLIEAIHKITGVFGSFSYRWFDENCNEQFTEEYDEYTPEPPSNCADPGGGGGDEATSDPDPSGSTNWQFLCDQLNLESGDWDIIVDGDWVDTITCT